MESGKREEAGPSTTVGVDGKQEKQKGVAEKSPTEAVVHEVEEDEEEEDEDDNGVPVTGFVPGPLVSLKEQIEKDKDDDSLRRWKQKLLGCLESDINDQMEPRVRFHSIGIISDDFGEITTSLPGDEIQSAGLLFSLREGSRYRRKLTFSVLHNIVSGLTYSNTVRKGGLQVDQSRGMLGTFAPQRQPYVHTLEEETTPSGPLARGTYAAMLKFEDDDRRCHMELKYSFEIKKGS